MSCVTKTNRLFGICVGPDREVPSLCSLARFTDPARQRVRPSATPATPALSVRAIAPRSLVIPPESSRGMLPPAASARRPFQGIPSARFKRHSCPSSGCDLASASPMLLTRLHTGKMGIVLEDDAAFSATALGMACPFQKRLPDETSLIPPAGAGAWSCRIRWVRSRQGTASPLP